VLNEPTIEKLKALSARRRVCRLAGAAKRGAELSAKLRRTLRHACRRRVSSPRQQAYVAVTEGREAPLRPSVHRECRLPRTPRARQGRRATTRNVSLGEGTSSERDLRNDRNGQELSRMRPGSSGWLIRLVAKSTARCTGARRVCSTNSDWLAPMAAIRACWHASPG
jgi:hypothetical protein